MKQRHCGFTLIELMVVIAIIAVLGAIAVVGYRMYVERAAAADLVSAHHAIRNYVQGLGGKTADDCAALAAGYERKLLADPYARLDYGFEAVPGGFRPVLSVCATAQSDARNIPVAKRAHDSFVNIGVMEKGAVLSDSVVSYALRLTDGEQALCKTAPAASGPACAPTQAAASPAKPAQTPPPAQPAQAPAQPAAQPAQPATPPACPSDQERVGGSCVPKCRSFEVRWSDGRCINRSCGSDKEWVNGVCTHVCISPQTRDASGNCVCPQGQESFNGRCLPVCGANQERIGWACEQKCAADQERVGLACAPKCAPDLERVGQQCLPKCPAGQGRDAANNCASCLDTYGPTCDTDFGLALCGDAFVQEMCNKYCGVCK